ncbi:MAG: hypothetical protein ACJ8EY_05350 [Sphingomicrobium sp.]
MTRRILLFGDSHADAIQAAIKCRRSKAIPVGLDARRVIKIKKVVGNPPSPRPHVLRRLGHRLRALIDDRPAATDGSLVVGDTTLDQFSALARRLQPDDVLISVIGGNQYAVFSTIQHPKPFDFELPGDPLPSVAGDEELIPFRTLYDYFLTALRAGDGETLAHLRRSTRARMLHLLAPPPKRDNDFIQRHHDTHFAAQGIGHLGVSSAELRMKFWKLQKLAIGEICAELDIETVEPPKEALDADGYLAPHYYAGDATHANEAYGELVLEQLETRFAFAPYDKAANG